MTPMVSATIDTAALKHNLQRIRDFAPRSRVMAVIKANAYGHGLVAVARALDQADAFAVARVDEGLTLRMAGIQKRIVLLEGVFDRGQLDSASAAGFELVVHTREQIELLRQARRGRAVSDLAEARHRHEPARLQGRGFRRRARWRCAPCRGCNRPSTCSPTWLRRMIPTRPRPSSSSRASRRRPRRSRRAQHRQLRRHAGFSQAQADWVRPGLLLYGVSPFDGSIGADYGLLPVMTLRSHVIALKEIASRVSTSATAVPGRRAVRPAWRWRRWVMATATRAT